METSSRGNGNKGAGGNNNNRNNRRRGGRKNNNNNNNDNDTKNKNRNNPKKHKDDNTRSSHMNSKRSKTTTAPRDVGQRRSDVPGPSSSERLNTNDKGTNSDSAKLAHITNHRFADLKISAESRRAMAEVFRYEFMTAVQSETLPLILKENKDCLAKAKTGTGKTLAFMIPTIEKIMASMSNNARQRSDICCLVISPTRELAQQIGTETERLLSFHERHLKKVVVCVGGTNKNKDVKSLSGTTPIVVATPGRLLDHLQTSGLAERMARLDTLIFDEADQLLDMGFRPDIERILRLLQPSRETRQTLLFSATIPDSVSEIAGIAMRRDYNFVDTVGEDSEQTHLHVQQQLMVTPQALQIQSLANILERETKNNDYKIIVFFTTARLTGFMAELFNSVKNQTGYDVLEIHSRKSQKQRERASDEFRKRKNAVMFSSDVTARGMDYPGVTFVLQVGLTDRSQYIHRLGRTARAGKDGKGGLLLAEYERDYMVKKELADMPLESTSIPSLDTASSAATRAIQNVSKTHDLRTAAEQAYRAWLGYYNGHLKKVKWDKKTLVQQANMWGAEVGLKAQPSLQKRTIGKMGLRGTPGLIIEN
uniref:ATP-dependent RNA helicase n=1 Tax=Pseudo-nitzschia australis TaxID=44445 RepID=A0A7S4AEW1_9STRA|mmetsp:Transcript_24236/g.51146  ORF Transcript_24236/g.51146 Transcript_24236/m.51146 type:complete len:594 (-) Transcript_24236:87-1868(-)